MSLSADQIWKQVRWEQKGVQRGIDRYREAALTADPTLLPPGQRLLREVIPPMSEAIKAAQIDSRAQIAARGKVHAWNPLIILLEPDKLAVIAASTILRSPDHGDGKKVLELSLAVGRMIRVQVEMDAWVDNALAVREKGVWDALATFRLQFPDANARQWRRWQDKMKIAATVEWTKTQEVSLGGHLVGLAAQACPEWFELKTVRIGAKTPALLVMSPQAKETMKDVEARAELASPHRMPMLVPPLPWRYEA